MCEMTKGFLRVCDSTGGVRRAILYSKFDDQGSDNVDTLEMDTTPGEITDLTLKSGKQAFSFTFEVETANATDNAVGEKANSAYAREQSVMLIMAGNSPEKIAEFELMGKGRICVILELEDGTFEHFFIENGAKMLDERATGTAYEDFNGTTLNFSGKERIKARKIDSAIAEALLTAAV